MPEIQEYRNILVPVRHPNDVNRIAEFAQTMVGRGKITFLTVIREDDFMEMQSDWRESSQVIEKYEDRITSRKIRIDTEIRYSDSTWKGIVEQAEEDDSDVILMGWGGKITFRSLRQTPVEKVLSHSDRDVVVFQNQGTKIEGMEKILLPVAYKDYNYSKRLSLILQLIESTGAECTLGHVLLEGRSEEEVEDIFEGPREFMKENGVDVGTKIIEGKEVPDTLIDISSDYDLIVLGPTREYVFSRYMFGWLTDEVVNNSRCSSLVFKEAERPWKAWLRGAIFGLGKEIKNLFK
ncbi:MAG: universal stress protein [Candidatus Hadarchaeota archaeon]